VRETWQAAFDACLARTDDPFLANREADLAVEAARAEEGK
jgi:hypothetical protein